MVSLLPNHLSRRHHVQRPNLLCLDNHSAVLLPSVHERVGTGDSKARLQVPQGVHEAVPMLDCHILQHETAKATCPNGRMPPVRTPQRPVHHRSTRKCPLQRKHRRLTEFVPHMCLTDGARPLRRT